MLLTKGTPNIERLLRSMQARDALIGRPSHTIAPGAAGAALGGLLSY
jgi:hypothetical protein